MLSDICLKLRYSPEIKKAVADLFPDKLHMGLTSNHETRNTCARPLVSQGTVQVREAQGDQVLIE